MLQKQSWSHSLVRLALSFRTMIRHNLAFTFTLLISFVVPVTDTARDSSTRHCETFRSVFAAEMIDVSSRRKQIKKDLLSTKKSAKEVGELMDEVDRIMKRSDLQLKKLDDVLRKLREFTEKYDRERRPGSVKDSDNGK